jgi:hypothetical protein
MVCILTYLCNRRKCHNLQQDGSDARHSIFGVSSVPCYISGRPRIRHSVYWHEFPGHWTWNGSRHLDAAVLESVCRSPLFSLYTFDSHRYSNLRLFKREAQKHGGQAPPETRLIMGQLGGILVPIGTHNPWSLVYNT